MLIEKIERTMGTTTMAPRKKRDTANRAGLSSKLAPFT